MSATKPEEADRVAPWRWQKGKSANPGGRKGAPDVSKRIRTLLGQNGIDEIALVLFDIVQGKNRLCAACIEDGCTGPKGAQDRGCTCQDFLIATKDRISAAKLLYERVYGYPAQKMQITDPTPADDLTKLSNEQLIELERVAAETDEGSDAPDPDRPH